MMCFPSVFFFFFRLLSSGFLSGLGCWMMCLFIFLDFTSLSGMPPHTSNGHSSINTNNKRLRHFNLTTGTRLFRLAFRILDEKLHPSFLSADFFIRNPTGFPCLAAYRDISIQFTPKKDIIVINIRRHSA